MRFLFLFSTSTLTGQAVQSYNIIRYLCKNGHKVWVLSDQNRDGDLNRFIEISGAINIRNISISNKNRSIFSKYEEISGVRSLVLDLRPDFVVSSFSNDHFTMSLATSGLSSRLRTIRMFHSERIRADILHRKIYHATDLLFFFDLDIYTEFQRKYEALNKRLFLLSPSVDTNVFVVRDKKESKGVFGIRDESFVVGYVGMFQKGRMHRLLIDAFCEFAKSQNNATLLMVGGGETLEEIKKYALKKDCSEHILFTGFIDEERLVFAYNCMDVFLLLKGGHDSSLRMLYEAQSCGTYILTYRSYPATRLLMVTNYGDVLINLSIEQIVASLSSAVNYTSNDRRDAVHKSVVAEFDIERLGRDFIKICETFRCSSDSAG